MALEIERKFLVKDDSWKFLAKGVSYKQGYLFASKEKSVRIRIAGDKGFVTIKGSRLGIVRDEFEYEIPCADAIELLNNYCTNGLVEKNRYKILYKEKIWEVDEFLGKNKGLIIAEIELNDASEIFEKPIWVGEDVSHEPKYYNSNLVSHPFCEW